MSICAVRPASTSTLWWRREGIVVPVMALLVPAVIGGAVLAAVWSDLPGRIAIHWGASGDADGFAGRDIGLIALALGMPLIVGMLMTAIVLTVPPSAPGGRVVDGIAPATTWFVVGLTVSSVVDQTDGVSDLRMRWLVIAAVAGLIGGSATAMLVAVPAPPPASDRPPPEASRLDRQGATTLAWTGRTSSGRVVWVVVAVAMIPTVVCLVLGLWPMVLVVAPVVLVVLGSTRFTVTVGAERVVVSGAVGGLPRLRVDLASITEATTTSTTVFEWGGWGIRARPGSTGVITRAGEALQMRRTDDTTVVLTVDDAATAAATVNSLLDRRSDAARAR